MEKYIVVEIQHMASGQVANIVTAYDDRNQAESAYHTILAAAAISSVYCHTALMMTSDGMVLHVDSYKHDFQEA